jgi:hypothetical protein
MKKIALIVVIVVIAFVFALPAFLAGRHRADRRAQAVWLWSAVQKLQNLGAPSPNVTTNLDASWWAKDGFLVFSNGWVSFAYHTFHDSEDIGDIALLRTPEGVFFVSYYHFCLGATTFDTRDQPKDFSEFMQVFGTEQKWTRGMVPNNFLEPSADNASNSASRPTSQAGVGSLDGR